jgi:hypothetical protein
MIDLHWFKQLADYFGGSENSPPHGFRLLPGSWLWGLWWGALAALIILFSGQTTKFIYIDF